MELQVGLARRRRRVEAQGEVPSTLNWVTIEFYPCGGNPFRVWFDGMSFK